MLFKIQGIQSNIYFRYSYSRITQQINSSNSSRVTWLFKVMKHCCTQNITHYTRLPIFCIGTMLQQNVIANNMITTTEMETLS